MKILLKEFRNWRNLIKRSDLQFAMIAICCTIVFQFQSGNVLREELLQRRSTARILQKEFSSLKALLQSELNLVYCANISTFFSELMTRFSNQQKKFYKLLIKGKTENHSEKLLFNYSNCVLSHTEKKLLQKL